MFDRAVCCGMRLVDTPVLEVRKLRSLKALLGHASVTTGDHPLSGGPWVFHCQELQTKAAADLVERTHRRNGHAEIPSSQQRNLDFSRA